MGDFVVIDMLNERWNVPHIFRLRYDARMTVAVDPHPAGWQAARWITSHAGCHPDCGSSGFFRSSAVVSSTACFRRPRADHVSPIGYENGRCDLLSGTRPCYIDDLEGNRLSL
jgi:hypothetical protein